MLMLSYQIRRTVYLPAEEVPGSSHPRRTLRGIQEIRSRRILFFRQAIPVFLWEGLLTLLAGALKPVMTDLAMSYLSLVGSVLIFCVGLNLVWGKRIRVANLLPAVFLAVAASYLPIRF